MVGSHETVFLEIAGKKTQLTRGGEGPPLVYLHSAAGDADWLPLPAQLAASHTVYVPAHPGFALSAGLEKIDSMADLAWHYVDFFAALGLKNVPVVGFSLGGWLALELALLRPELVNRLVLVAAAGLHLDDAPMAELFIDDLDALRALLFHDPQNPVAVQALPTSLEDPRILLWLRAREATARVAWNPYLHNPQLRRHLHRITAPTLLVWGRHDRVIPAAHGQCFAQSLPNARLRMLDDCGHMVPYEKTVELAAAIRDFTT